ncbi:MAG TPA: maleylpyruvate isomerase family mycothiol-dependent enzyme [Streptosporangiaceae bacterium]|nr:maleylpyruvate isomerase family mycothiol-dependent enzyme [Streptosporangiaceae bacterium]
MDSDPASLRGRIDEATSHLTATADRLTDEQAREPSLLPGWSRGHVLTHLARNADGLRNLLIWARTGVATPQYPSQEARNAGIAAGAGRPAAKLADDLRESAAAFAREAAGVPAGSWTVMVGAPEHAAWFTLLRRLGEVEIHHVDLGAGYGPADWPGPFVADELERVMGQYADRDDVPPCLLELSDTGQRLVLGPPAAPGQAREDEVTVRGPACWMLAWLIGRDPGRALAVRTGQEPADGASALPPKLPNWS